MSSRLTTSPATRRDDLLIPGEFRLTRRDFEGIAAMLQVDAGIYLADSKATLVYSRLAKRLRALKLRSFGEYCALIGSEGGLDERQNMVSALTTNVTRFFREPHHFDDLKTNVLPTLIDTARHGVKVRFWSAACSSGQEPYSIALTILALEPNAARLDVKVLATDIDYNMIEQGIRGNYSESALANVPLELRRRYFKSRGEGGITSWNVADELRELVVFRQLNLNADWPMTGKFHAIFCRNVVIYFGGTTQQEIWKKFATKLITGGRLYIGHSERVTGPAAPLFESTGVTTYRFKGGAWS